MNLIYKVSVINLYKYVIILPFQDFLFSTSEYSSQVDKCIMKNNIMNRKKHMLLMTLLPDSISMSFSISLDWSKSRNLFNSSSKGRSSKGMKSKSNKIISMPERYFFTFPGI